MKKSGTNSPDAKVQMSNQPVKESRIGTCICGGPNVLGILCEHMAAVVQASYNKLSTTNIMPFWWTMEELQVQYAMMEIYPKHIMLDYVINSSGIPDENLCYCPTPAAAQKTRRPK